jgi:protein-S-isoprenylcysteine O-methyltransferase Ste14
MKKEVRKYTVINSLSEGGIRSVGMDRWMRQLGWKFYAWAIGMLLYCLVFLFVIDDNTAKWIRFLLIVPVVVAIVTFYYKWFNVGAKFWNKVKDLPEPIDLREVK